MLKMVFTLSVVFFMLLHMISGEDCASKKVSIVANVLEDNANGTFSVNIKDVFWHVSVLQLADDGSLHFLCGGSLVHRRLVVTAAGCVARANMTRLRAAVGLTTMRRHLDGSTTDYLLYNVSEKYYPYRDNYTVNKDDLAILRLSNANVNASAGADAGVGGDLPRLSVLPPGARLSKRCFTVGWGLDSSLSMANQMVERCTKPGYKSALRASLYQSKYSHMNLKNLLDFPNILGITKYFAFSLSNVLNMFTNSTENDFPQLTEEPTCSPDEYCQLQTVKMSASGKLRNATVCANASASAICLQASGTASELVHRVDIGSPIFCKIKKPKAAKNCPQQNSPVSQFALAGVVTSKRVKDHPLPKYNTTISVIKATNVTQYADFILSVLNRKN